MELKQKILEILKDHEKLTKNELIQLVCKNDPNFINGHSSIMSFNESLTQLEKQNEISVNKNSKEEVFSLKQTKN